MPGHTFVTANNYILAILLNAIGISWIPCALPEIVDWRILRDSSTEFKDVFNVFMRTKIVMVSQW